VPVLEEHVRRVVLASTRLPDRTRRTRSAGTRDR
jgi:hypothetical protein